jgi:hypothetical protein
MMRAVELHFYSNSLIVPLGARRITGEASS